MFNYFAGISVICLKSFKANSSKYKETFINQIFIPDEVRIY